MELNRKIPKVRFNKFKGEWFEDLFGSLAVIKRGLTYSPNDIRKNGVKVLRSSNIKEDVFVENDDDVFVDEGAINIEYINNNDILITAANGSSRLVGKHAIVNTQNNRFVHGGFMLLAVTKNPFFLNASMSSEWYRKFINKNIAGGNGAIGNLNKNHLAKEKILIPHDDEQTQIGNFLKTFDEQISLQEQKHQKLINLKKAMLEKMFPKEGADVPEIRFKGFTDKWEVKKLGDVFEKIRNAFVGTATPYYVKKGHFYLESNNVKDGSINRKTEVFINDFFYYKQKDNWLKTGDIVMVQSGHVGHSAVICEELNNSAAHALIMFSKPRFSVSSKFINYQFYTTASKSRIEKITTGNTIKHILSSDMKEYEIKLPSLQEQQKISDYFENLDQLIQQSQAQLDKFKNIKQALLQKMFV